ncbi:MAG: hypothetical protein AAFQ67_06715, partial [Pseudomonadota bacterium]
ILMAGLTAVSANLFGGQAFEQSDVFEDLSGAPARVLMPVAAIAWLLAEYFCSRRRLLLPSMALALVIVLFTGISSGVFFATDNLEQQIDASGGLGALAGAGFGFSGGWLVAACLFFLRFRLPFSLLLVALGIALMAYAFAAANGSLGAIFGGGLSLLLGFGFLGAALFFDAQDPERASRTSDHAFWLHFAAAPQIIIGLRGLVSGYALSNGSLSTTTEAVLMILCLTGLGILSLLVNRRALIVSGLLSFAFALGVLADEAGADGATSFMVVALILGGGVVLLGGGWRTVRRNLLRLTPQTGFFGRVFPPEPA